MKDFSIYENPISIENPAGFNIEYDNRFLELQRLAEGVPEQQYGDVIIDSKAPEWNTLEKLCNQLLADSKDVTLFAYNILILTAKYGLIGFEAGCRALSINLERYWEEIYPKLIDEDNEFDPYYRINALSLLTSPEGIVKHLGASKLLSNGLNHQSVSLKDAVLVLQDDAKIDYAGGRERLFLDIKIGFDSNKTEFIALKNSLNHIENIERIYETKISDNLLPSFDVIKKHLKLILSTADYGNDLSNSGNLEKGAENSQGIDTDSITPSNTAQQSLSQPIDVWRKAVIENRNDVELILEKVCLYFEQYEPSHPAPLFIRRIQRLMNMNFYDIMKDISPSSLDHLEVLIGQTNDDENNTN